jgi:hypothetical protein
MRKEIGIDFITIFKLYIFITYRMPPKPAPTQTGPVLSSNNDEMKDLSSKE